MAEEVSTAEFRLNDVDWSKYEFYTTQGMNDFLNYVKDRQKQLSDHVNLFAILHHIEEKIQVREYIQFLEMLCSDTLNIIRDSSWGDFLIYCIEKWSKVSLAVKQWKNEKLSAIISKNLPMFCKYFPTYNDTLPKLLDLIEINDEEKAKVLLAGIEGNTNFLALDTLYALIELIVKFSTPQDAAKVLMQFVDRLISRVPEKEREPWTLADLPNGTSESLARLFYALMSDIDVRNRWQSAHAMRCLARLGNIETIDHIINLYSRKIENNFRNSNAPFYWAAARLWVFITFARIAKESPQAINPHAEKMLSYATDSEFPHVLLRHFAKEAIKNLVAHGALNWSAKKLKEVEQINISSIFSEENLVSNNLGLIRQENGEKFKFDTMDTLPYWYEPALKIFTDVTAKKFLECAENWIINKWEEFTDGAWDTEKRRSRLSERIPNWMNSHGSYPTFERYKTYLEWHAMCCTIGELLSTHYLREDNDHPNLLFFNRWLEEHALTLPPIWLADLRGNKPLNKELWLAPILSDETWVEEIQEKDFLKALKSEANQIVVDGYYTVYFKQFELSVRISTSLVSPFTADSLVRALQTANDANDYRLPPANNEFEINKPPYQLKGWLVNRECYAQLDEHDSYRVGVRGIESCPSPFIVDMLNLEFSIENRPSWVNKDSKLIAFEYEAWGDYSSNTASRGHYYMENIHSEGWYLKVEKNSLKALLENSKFDLIAEIEITHRKRGDEYTYSDEESKKRARFTRLYLLKRDGSISSAE